MNAGDFRLLYYFVEIVKAGSIRGAARHLRLSPAVVSTALSDLEAALSVTLIARTTRKMHPDRGRPGHAFDKAELAITDGPGCHAATRRRRCRRSGAGCP